MTDDMRHTLDEIVRRLEAVGIRYMVVGSIAALAHGRSRATQNFDVVVDPNETALLQFVRGLPSDRFYASEDAALDALRRESMFNVIDIETGWKVDVVPRKHRKFSQTEFERRQTVVVLGTTVQVATPEDTIIAKLEWAKLGGGSARQLEDARELLRMIPDLDRAYIEIWVNDLGLGQEWHQVQSD